MGYFSKGTSMESKKNDLQSTRISKDELMDEVRSYIFNNKKKFYYKINDECSSEMLLWLTLVSDWTVELLKNSRITVFDKIKDPYQFLENLKNLGLCKLESEQERLEFDLKKNEPYLVIIPAVYTMLPDKCMEIIEELIKDPNFEIIRRAAEIGNAIAEIEQNSIISPLKIKWAKLLKRAAQPSELLEFLTGQIVALLEENEFDNAREWIDATSIIKQYPFWEPDFTQTLTEKIMSLNRRIELKKRMWDDKKHLDYFLERKEQITAFNNLIAGDDNIWALHYIGIGGVGKTMLMRYICTELVQKEINGSSVRIDFDYLNPDFPSKAPGLLLMKLAEGLRLFDQIGEATNLFLTFYNAVARYHERLTGISVKTITEHHEEKEFIDIIESFAEAAKKLPQPVIILLDTCEELEKFHPEENLPKNIIETLNIMEILHKIIPKMRVVFCGRRPLSSKGYKWEINGNLANSKYFTEKEYLKLYEIRGFTEDEAQEYLLRKVHIDKNLVAAILEKCKEKGYLMRFKFEDSYLTSNKQTHYNPFELDFFAKWVSENKDLTVERLGSIEWYEYIEIRILKRIQLKVLQEIMPAVALLGHFDSKVLINTTKEIIRKYEYEGKFHELYRELERQEWIDIKSDGTIEVERFLRQKLIECYNKKNIQVIEDFKNSALDYLIKYTITTPFGDGEIELYHFEILMDLLRNRPEQGKSWWQSIEHKIQKENQFTWALNFIQRLPMNIHQGINNLQIQISATLAALLNKDGYVSEANSKWKLVNSMINEIADKDLKRELFIRSQSGLIISSQSDSLNKLEFEKLLEVLIGFNFEELDENSIAAVICAIEILLEKIEMQHSILMPYLSEMAISSTSIMIIPLIHFANALSDKHISLQAFTYALIGKTYGYLDNLVEMKKYFIKALDLLKRSEQGDHVYSHRKPSLNDSWLDWCSSENVRDRILLEFITLLYSHKGSPNDALLMISPYSGDYPGLDYCDLDEDRLKSAILQLKLSTTAPSEKDIHLSIVKMSFQNNLYITRYKPRKVHSCFNPLYITILEALVDTGEIIEAFRIVKEELRTSMLLGEFSSQEYTSMFLLLIMRKMRLSETSYGWFLQEVMQNAVSTTEAMLKWAIEAFESPPEESPVMNVSDDMDYGRIHARWRTLFTHEPNLAMPALRWIKDWSEKLKDSLDLTFDSLSFMLDCLEAKLINDYQKMDFPINEFNLSYILKWCEQPSSEMEKAYRLMLRYHALTCSKEELHDAYNYRHEETLTKQIGLRRAAKIALDEGELLALRLPQEASIILKKAVEGFVNSKDFIGALLAQGCVSLVAARNNDEDNMLFEVTELRYRYRQILKHKVNIDFPDWQWIEEFIEQPDPDSFDKSVNKGWAAWIIRFAACIAKIKDDKDLKKQHIRCSKLIHFIREVSSHGVEDRISSELHGWFNKDLQETSDSTIQEEPLSISDSSESISIEVKMGNKIEPEMFFPNTIMVHLTFREKSSSRQTRESIGYIKRIGNDMKYEFECVDINFMSSINQFILYSMQNLSIEYLSIELKIDAQVSWICWEAIFMNKAITTHNFWKKLIFRRIIKGSSIEQWRESDYLGDIYGISKDKGLFDALEKAFYSTGTNFLPIDDFEISESRTSNLLLRKDDENRKLGLYISGVPIMTNYGIRLRLGKYSSNYEDERESSMNYYEISTFSNNKKNRYDKKNQEEMGFRQGTLLSMSDIYSNSSYKSIFLCILQSTPSSSLQITTNEQEEAAYLRMMGADLSAHKIPLVIVIPTLPKNHIVLIIRPIFEALDRIKLSKSWGFEMLEILSRGISKVNENILERMMQNYHNADKELIESASIISFYTAIGMVNNKWRWK